MIIKSLTEFYHQQLAVGHTKYAPPGMELKWIHYVLILDRMGRLVDIEQLERKLCVAKRKPRSDRRVADTANPMWDCVFHITGYSPEKEKQEIVYRQHTAFVKEVNRWYETHPENTTFAAVAAFYASSDSMVQLYNHSLWNDIVSKPRHNLSFRLVDEPLMAAQQPELLSPHEKSLSRGIRLATGQQQPIACLHPKIFLSGRSPSGAKQISFTKGCGYDSYGMRGANNVRISIESTEAYAVALMGMLQEGSSHHVKVGDVSILFFTLPITGFSELFKQLIDPAVKTDRNELLSVMADYAYGEDADTEFYLMGLVPNAARISVRFYLHTTIGKLYDYLLEFYNEIPLEYGDDLTHPPALLAPLFFAALNNDINHLSPQFIIDYLRAILTYTKFPTQMQSLLLDRIRQSNGVNLGATMMLRCLLNRKITKQFIPMSLQPQNPNIGYQLGRFFAVIERAQQLSEPGIRSTIRDSYYHTASITPSAVFGRLIVLSASYIRRIGSSSTAVRIKQQICEITNQINATGIPERLSSLDDQSRFALGYFHQRQTYFVVP